jgi:transposase
MLDQDAEVPATVILEHLRRRGYDGGITILKEHVATVRPAFLAARTYQRTTYLPGELAHGDWWEPKKTRIPVGGGATRKPYGWVTTLPHSAAHATVFSFTKTMADFLQATLGCFQRLGGVPDAMVVDNDPSIVADGVGKNARLHPEVSALCGHLGMRLIVLDPGKPESKGQVERTNGYLERSFLPLRGFADLDDLQSQHDAWTAEVAFRRHHRRVGGRVGDALAAERRYLHALPDPAPDVARRTEVRVQRDGFVRVGDVDYSVPPGLARRRVQVRISPREVVVHLEGSEIALHPRSFAPADVVLDPRLASSERMTDRVAGAGFVLIGVFWLSPLAERVLERWNRWFLEHFRFARRVPGVREFYSPGSQRALRFVVGSGFILFGFLGLLGVVSFGFGSA